MIELNLLPSEFRRKEVPKLVIPDLPIRKISLIGIPAIVGIHLVLILGSVGVSLRLGSLKHEIVEMKVKTEQTVRYKAETGSLRNRLSQAETQIKRPFYWSKLLSALSDSMIKGVWLNSLSVSDEAVGASEARSAKASSKGAQTSSSRRVLKLNGSVVGKGDETANVGKFIKELKENSFLSSLFSDIELSDMIQKRIKDFDVYDFLITCRFAQDKVPS